MNVAQKDTHETEPEVVSDKPRKERKIRFRASLPFSHLPPYDDLFAERVPILQVFQSACASYLMMREKSFLPAFQKPFVSVECGVYTGNSLLACANIAASIGIPFKMFGLDTFSGLPALSEKDISLAPSEASYLHKRLFDDTSQTAVQERINDQGFEKQIELCQGLFSKSLPQLPEQQYNFVNIDCDLYEPHLECLEYFYPRMKRGGFIFFDDYYSQDYPMARAAIDKFMADKPEKLIHIRYGNAGRNLAKCYFVKN